MMKKFSKNLIPVAIFVTGLLIAGALVYVNQGKVEEKAEVLSPQQAAEKAIDYINKNMLQEGAATSLVSVVEESGIYKFRLKIGDREYISYVTKDGNLLFPQEGVSLEEKTQTPETVQPKTPSIEEEPKEEPPTETVSLKALAKCLTEKGMKFYGTYWCGWCNKQKELFREAAKYLPYIECTNPETRQITPECQEAGITGFPTWQLPTGEKSSGFKSLQQLAELSGCPL